MPIPSLFKFHLLPSFSCSLSTLSLCSVNKSSCKIHGQASQVGSSDAHNSTTLLEMLTIAQLMVRTHLCLVKSHSVTEGQSCLLWKGITLNWHPSSPAFLPSLTLTAECHFTSIHGLSRRSGGFIQTTPIPTHTLFWGRKRETPHLALCSVLSFHRESQTHLKWLHFTATGTVKARPAPVLQSLCQTWVTEMSAKCL